MLMSLIPASQTATFEVDEAAAAVLGLNRTDLRCLGEAFKLGTVSPSALAEIVGLSRGAMTTAVDRLEAHGFLQRSDSLGDRRTVSLQVTDIAKKALSEIWGPIGEEGKKILDGFEEEELSVLVEFFRRTIELQERHKDRIRTLAQGGSS